MWRNLCTFLNKHMTYENECHLFFRCNRAVEVWTDAALWPVMEHTVMNVEDFKDLFFQLVFAMQLWCIWKYKIIRVCDNGSSLGHLEHR